LTSGVGESQKVAVLSVDVVSVGLMTDGILKYPVSADQL